MKTSFHYIHFITLVLVFTLVTSACSPNAESAKINTGAPVALTEDIADQTTNPAAVDDQTLFAAENPSQVIKAFYEAWISHPENPLAAEYYKTSGAFTPAGIANLESNKFDGMWMADPVLCAQDTPNSIEVSEAQINGSSASVHVITSFGTKIGVDLVQDGGLWKINALSCLR
jgi:hypothetical protein